MKIVERSFTKTFTGILGRISGGMIVPTPPIVIFRGIFGQKVRFLETNFGGFLEGNHGESLFGRTLLREIAEIIMVRSLVNIFRKSFKQIFSELT